MRRALVVLAVVGSACGGSEPEIPDASLGLDCSTGQCLTPPMLQVTNQGGASIAHMEVWTVVWEGDEDLGAQVDAFNAAVLASPYYTSSLSEYGVAGGEAKGVILLGAPPAAVNDAFYDAQVPELVGKTSSTGMVLEAPNDSTVITFVIPLSTKEPVGTSYHTETGVQLLSSAGTPIYIPYIVLAQASVGFVTDFEYLTWSQSHELGETATDPLPDFDPAWYNTDVDIEGEVADLCNNIPARIALSGTTYMLNRFYSQKLAAARKGDPCLPALGTPYANVAVSPLNLHIPSGVGKTGMLRLHAFAMAPVASLRWHIYADASYKVTPSGGNIAPGQDIDVTVTRTSPSPPDPTAVNVWVTDPSNPATDIPLAEWYGAITVGP